MNGAKLISYYPKEYLTWDGQRRYKIICNGGPDPVDENYADRNDAVKIALRLTNAARSDDPYKYGITEADLKEETKKFLKRVGFGEELAESMIEEIVEEAHGVEIIISEEA